MLDTHTVRKTILLRKKKLILLHLKVNYSPELANFRLKLTNSGLNLISSRLELTFSSLSL